MLVQLTTLVGQDLHRYAAQVSGSSTTLMEKQLLEQLHAADELGEYSVDRHTGQVEMKMFARMDRFRFEYMITPLGLTLVRFEEQGTHPTPLSTARRGSLPIDFPIYIDTGDPLRDNQRYDAYKAAWIAAYPETYEELTAPVPETE